MQNFIEKCFFLILTSRRSVFPTVLAKRSAATNRSGRRVRRRRNTRRMPRLFRCPWDADNDTATSNNDSMTRLPSIMFQLLRRYEWEPMKKPFASTCKHSSLTTNYIRAVCIRQFQIIFSEMIGLGLTKIMFNSSIDPSNFLFISGNKIYKNNKSTAVHKMLIGLYQMTVILKIPY